MPFRLLRGDEELETFCDNTEQYIAVRFPLDYLRNGKVVAYYSKDGRMLGGYALISKPPFRVIESLPEEVRSRHPALQRLAKTSLFEITGLWLAPELQLKRASFVLWLRLYRDAIALGKSHFVYAYSLTKPSLGRLYRVCHPEVVFRGRTRQLPGMLRAEEESVELSTVARAMLFTLLQPRFFLGRLFRGGRHACKAGHDRV